MITLTIDNSSQQMVLRCSGRILQGDGADTLLQVVMSEEERHILIDLDGVSAIDAAGLGALAALENWARDRNRTICLVNPSRQVREALTITGLGAVLQIRPNHKAA